MASRRAKESKLYCLSHEPCVVAAVDIAAAIILACVFSFLSVGIAGNTCRRSRPINAGQLGTRRASS
jgi:hypothetical protein